MKINRTGIPFMVAILAGFSRIVIAADPIPANPPHEQPVELTASDWSAIRGAYDAEKHSAFLGKGGEVIACNPGQQWKTVFDGRGFTTTPDSGDWSWGLELKGYGFGSDIQAVGKNAAQTSHTGGKVSYHWDGNLCEWFINDTRGVEHGWTLSHRPVGQTANEPLRLHLAVRGSLTPIVTSDAASISFRDGHGKTALTYGGLKAWDADGRILAVHFGSGPKRGIEILVDEHAARYPITIDPVAQQAYLKASNTGASDVFGAAVAISGDTIVVGAPGEGGYSSGVNGNQTNDPKIRTGAVYVFVRIGERWTQQAYVKAIDPIIEDGFGRSVAVSGDTMAIGSPGRDDQGAVFIFTRIGETWTQAHVIQQNSSYETGSEFGSRLALSEELTVLGKSGKLRSYRNLVVTDSRNTYFYEISGTSSVLKHKIPFKYYSLSISRNTAVVGNPFQDSPGHAGTVIYSTGSAYVYEYDPIVESWASTATLGASNMDENDYFGYSVAISGDTIVAGAPNEASDATGVNGNQTNNNLEYSGAAYVFRREEQGWTQDAYLKASNSSAAFGRNVAIHSETIVIGTVFESNAAIGVNGPQSVKESKDYSDATASGAAYVFRRTGGSWSQLAYLKAQYLGYADNFGNSVAVSGDTAVIGALGDDNNGTGVDPAEHNRASQESGAAYAYDLNAPPYPLINIQQNGRELSNAGASEIDFGSVAAGKSAKSMEFTIWNQGTADLTGIRIAKSSRMDVDEGSQNFEVLGPIASTLSPGASTTFTVTFKPETNYDSGAIIHVISNSFPAGSFDINLRGIGLKPEIFLYRPVGNRLFRVLDDYGKQSFGTKRVGDTSAAKTFTIRNVGNAKITGLKVTSNGPHAKDFIMEPPSKTTLDPGKSITFKIRFKPTAKGVRKASFHINGRIPKADPFDINVTGQGVGP